MSGLGEFDLIDALAARLDPPEDGLGIGDDAAVWRPGPGSVVVATTDMLVEGVHFRLDWTSPRDLGWKALAVSLSDLAAMGARPGRGLVSVALMPGQTELVEELYEGLSELARLTGARIVGGDTVRSSGPLVVDVAMLGEAYPEQLLRRDGAHSGDLLALTGTVGAAAAGLDLLLRDDRQSLQRPEAARLLAALHRPEARLAAGAALAALGLKCAIDVSDGVASEAWHVARASRVAVEIDVDRLPLAPEAVALLGRSKARDLALSGGEDYQLLFAVSEARLAEVTDALGEDGPPVVVGRVTGDRPGGHVTLLASGAPVESRESGYVAF
ncbi:MAG: thiamine-phosphate kinase [Candidatus Limnocylindrales bacterium]